MNVLMLSPGYPAEMRQFTRALARAGARVIGVGDQPKAGLSQDVRDSLTAYVQLDHLWDQGEMLKLAHELHKHQPLSRVECLWEPGMVLAAQVRESLGLPGLTVEKTLPFRDKEVMKQALDRQGIRTPRHRRVRTREEAREAAQEIGFPLILKPISGAGSTDTHRVDSGDELERAVDLLGHVEEISVEEFVDGEEFTFDTICAGGRILYHNIAWYRPRPLQGKLHEWISPQAVCLRDLDVPHLEAGARMGVEVLEALDFETGFSHMEWYRKADGEVVFGEIGARPPGARLVDLMNYASDVDVYRGWAEAVVHGRWTQPIERKFNAAIVFKRAQGEGVIQKITGLEGLLERFGEHVASIELLEVGQRRRDWQQTQVSDGFVVVRHPRLQATLEMADSIGSELHLYAG